MFIKDIGLDPFFVYYFSGSQINWYKNYVKTERSLISIDATGKCIAPLEMEKDSILQCNKKPIFLYAMVASNQSGPSVCIAQMISEDHTSLRIEHWIRTWLKEASFTPREIIMDESNALILATVRAFTRFNDLDSYLEQCVKVLEDKSTELPETLIRIDISHLIKTICRNHIFKNVDGRIKRFFLHSFGLLFWIVDFNAVKVIFSDILTVCLNKFERNGCEDLLAEKSRQRLTYLIKSHSTSEIDFIIEQEEAEKQPEDDFSDDEYKNTWWYIRILENIETNIGDKHNMFYFPKLEPVLKKYAKRLPLYSAAMAHMFKSEKNIVSSSNVESNFRYIKRDLFQNKKHMRADAFIFDHIIDLLGATKIANAKYIKPGNLLHILSFSQIITYKTQIIFL